MTNTTDKSILTAAGKALLAQLNAEEKPLIIDKMIFANVPNRPEFPQPDDVVPTDHVVHQEGVEQRGRLSADSVIYSTTLTSDVGPFEFNWTGAYCSEYGVLVTIDHHALTPKSADEPGIAGNTLVRSVVLEYKDIAEITNITVDASSWQYNATPRMKKMDDDVAQSIIDQNGKDWFIEDGFLVTPSGSAYSIKAGAGYVSGNRVAMEFDRSVQVPNKPSFIYIDAHREGTPTGEQVTLFNFVVTAEEKDDYIDSSTGKDVKHFVCKIAQVHADGSVSDLRPEGDSKQYVDQVGDIITSEWSGLKVHPQKQGLPTRMNDVVESGVDALRIMTEQKQVKIYLLEKSLDKSSYVSDIDLLGGVVTLGDEQYKIYPQKIKIPTAKSFGVFATESIHENQIVETDGYYTSGDGGGAIYSMSSTITADGYGNHRSGELTAVLISMPTDKNHGVLTTETLVPEVALNNRSALEAMLRNQRFNNFEFVSNGDVHIIGSIHPLRSHIKIRHDKACNIKGYLSDPSASTVSVGHIFGFPIYKDPDNNELDIVEQCVGVEYQLEGDIASIYRDIHVKSHNNNCIGFYNAKSCYVVGSGGVSESDHKGITFDGDAVDCHIDIGYIKRTSNEPWQMKGNGTEERYTNTVRVGIIENPKFDGENPNVVGFVSNCDLCVVRIGSYIGDKSLSPILVGAFSSNKVIVKESYCENVSQILRQYDTAHGEVFDVNYKDADSVVTRAGSEVDKHKSSSIKRVICKGGGSIAAYHSEVNVSKFDRLIIKDNDFSLVSTPGEFELYKGQAAASLPKNIEISGNETPNGYDSTRHPNMSYGLSGNLISGTPHSFAYQIFEPDYLYTKMSLQLLPSSGVGVRFQTEVNLRSLSVSSQTYHLMIGDKVIECVNESGVLTFSAPVGFNFSWVEGYN